MIDDKWVFVGAAAGTRASSKLKAGEYAFAAGSSIQQVLNTIVSGKVIEYVVTIPEGLTSDQIVERVLAVEELSGSVRQVPREGSLMRIPTRSRAARRARTCCAAWRARRMPH